MNGDELLWLICGFTVGWGAAIAMHLIAQGEHDRQMQEIDTMTKKSVRATAELLHAVAQYEDAKRDAEKVSLN